MKIYFTYKGTFREYELDEIAFDYIQFSSNNVRFCIDTIGTIDIELKENYIDGRFKGEVECLVPELRLTEEEIAELILNMDTTSFEIGLFEEGDEPAFDTLDVSIVTCKGCKEFTVTNKYKKTA